MSIRGERETGDEPEHQPTYYREIGKWCIPCPVAIYCETVGETIWTGRGKIFTQYQQPTSNELRHAAKGYFFKNGSFLFGRHIHDCPGSEPKSLHRVLVRVSNPTNPSILFKKELH